MSAPVTEEDPSTHRPQSILSRGPRRWVDCWPRHSFFLTSKTRAGKDLDCDSQSFQCNSKIAHGPVDTCLAMVSNDAVLYLIKLTSRFISARKAPSIRPAMKTGTNLTARQSEFLRQFLLGASGFYLYPKEAQNVVLTAMAADWSSPVKSTKLVDKPIAGVTEGYVRYTAMSPEPFKNIWR